MLTIVGVAIVLLALRDVRHELFHPERTGTLSRVVSRGLWRASRAIGARYRPFLYRAGPAMLVAIGATWLGMVATGSALITLDHLPRDFNINPALPPAARHGLVTAFYVAMGMLTSAGSTDITPVTALMRVVSALEPVAGLVVITAWITWVLSIYPVLAERRAFTREVDLTRRAQPDPAAIVSGLPEDAVAALLRDFTGQVARLATQLGQARITYYFQNDEPDRSLPSTLPYVLALAQSAEGADPPGLRLLGARLRLAVEDLLCDIGHVHLGVDTTPDRIIEALARDHLRQVPPGVNPSPT